MYRVRHGLVVVVLAAAVVGCSDSSARVSVDGVRPATADEKTVAGARPTAASSDGQPGTSLIPAPAEPQSTVPSVAVAVSAPGSAVVSTAASSASSVTTTTASAAGTQPVAVAPAGDPVVTVIAPAGPGDPVPVGAVREPAGTPSPPPADTGSVPGPPGPPAVAGLRLVSGTYDLTRVVRQLEPTIVDTIGATRPTDVTVGVAVEGIGPRPAETGRVVRFRFRMHAWQTGELYDGTTDAAPLVVTLGDGTISPTLAAALVGATAGTVLIVTYPVGVAGLPDFVPDDDAYYLIVQVDDVT